MIENRQPVIGVGEAAEFAQDRLSVRIDAVSRDNIIRERLTGSRVIERDGLAIAVDESGENAVDFIRSGYPRLTGGTRQQLLLPFAREEPENALAELFGTQWTKDALRQPDRAAQVEALIVVPVEVALAALRIILEAVGVELFVAVKVVAGAVEIFAAALGHDLNVAARRAAVFGLIIRGQNLELRDVVEHQRDVLRAVRSGVDVGRAVNRQVVLVGAGAVDIEVGEAARTRRLRVDCAEHAWREFDQVEEVATVKRQVGHLLAADDLALLAALGFDQQLRSVGRHLY